MQMRARAKSTNQQILRGVQKPATQSRDAYHNNLIKFQAIPQVSDLNTANDKTNSLKEEIDQ